MARPWPPSSSISATVCWMGASRRPVQTTLTPRLARHIAMPLPMPCQAPVTMATFSLSCFMWYSSRGMPQRRVRAILRNLATRVRGAFAERWGFAGEGFPPPPARRASTLSSSWSPAVCLTLKRRACPASSRWTPPWCALRAPSHVTHRGRLIAKPNVRRNVVVDRELDKFL